METTEKIKTEPKKKKIKENINALNPQKIPFVINEQKTSGNQTAIFS